MISEKMLDKGIFLVSEHTSVDGEDQIESMGNYGYGLVFSIFFDDK